MTLCLKNARQKQVKLLTLNHHEVEIIRVRAAEIFQRVAAEYNRLPEGSRHSALKALAEAYENNHHPSKSDYVKSRPEALDPLINIHIILRESLVNSNAQIHVLEAKDLDDLQKRLTESLVGNALEAKVTASDPTLSVKQLIEDEIQSKGAYLDTWTELMAGQEKPFDARQQFRDRMNGLRDIFTGTAFFMPDTIEGITPYLRNAYVGSVGKEDGYRFGFGFLEYFYKAPNGQQINISPDLYTVDHRLLDNMVKAGGAATRESLLGAYQAMADMATHANVHNTVINNNSMPGAPLHEKYDPVGFDRRLDGLPALEMHALRTHKAIMRKMLARETGREEAVARQAIEFADLLKTWEKEMIAQGELACVADGMAKFMAHQYMERMNCLWDFNDPFFHNPVTISPNHTCSIADAYAEFAPERMMFTAGDAARILSYSSLYNYNTLVPSETFKALKLMVLRDKVDMLHDTMFSPTLVNMLCGKPTYAPVEKGQYVAVFETLQQLHALYEEGAPDVHKASSILLKELNSGELQVEPKTAQYVRSIVATVKRNQSFPAGIYFTREKVEYNPIEAYLDQKNCAPEIAAMVRAMAEVTADEPYLSHTPLLLRRIFGDRLEHLEQGIAVSGFDAFIAEHMQSKQHRFQMVTHVTDRTKFGGAMVPPETVTAAYHKDFLSTAYRLGTTSKSMQRRHLAGKESVLAVRAIKEKLRGNLRLDDLIGKDGLIVRLEAQLPTADIDDATRHALTNAIKEFRETAIQTEHAIETRAGVDSPIPQRHKDAISELEDALCILPYDGPLGNLPAIIRGKLHLMETTLDRATCAQNEREYVAGR